MQQLGAHATTTPTRGKTEFCVRDISTSGTNSEGIIITIQ